MTCKILPAITEAQEDSITIYEGGFYESIALCTGDEPSQDSTRDAVLDIMCGAARLLTCSRTML